MPSHFVCIIQQFEVLPEGELKVKGAAAGSRTFLREHRLVKLGASEDNASCVLALIGMNPDFSLLASGFLNCGYHVFGSFGLGPPLMRVEHGQITKSVAYARTICEFAGKVLAGNRRIPS